MGFDYSGFRYGTNLLMGRGCTCCMLGMRSGVGEEELWVTMAQSRSAIALRQRRFFDLASVFVSEWFCCWPKQKAGFEANEGTDYSECVRGGV